jgi:hypothetical protein
MSNLAFPRLNDQKGQITCISGKLAAITNSSALRKIACCRLFVLHILTKCPIG